MNFGFGLDAGGGGGENEGGWTKVGCATPPRGKNCRDNEICGGQREENKIVVPFLFPPWPPLPLSLSLLLPSAFQILIPLQDGITPLLGIDVSRAEGRGAWRIISKRSTSSLFFGIWIRVGLKTERAPLCNFVSGGGKTEFCTRYV